MSIAQDKCRRQAHSRQPRVTSDLQTRRDFPSECAAWHDNAERLADWAADRWVNRADIIMLYRPIGARDRGAVWTEHRALSRVDLLNHFTCKNVANLLVIPAIAPDNTSLWAAIDLDAHGEPDEDVSQRNLEAAELWASRLEELGFCVAILDSNGSGGIHVITFFAEPLASDDVHCMMQHIVADWHAYGLAERPETFPKQPCLTPKRRIGNGLRLPGLHHTLPHITRVRSNGCWLAGQAAVEALLAITPEPGVTIPNRYLDPAIGSPNLCAGAGTQRRLRNLSLPENARDEHLPPIERVLTRLKKMGRDPTECGEGYAALCPSHNDHTKSLSICEGDDGRVLICCHAGCEFRSIVYRLGLEPKDLAARGTTTRASSRQRLLLTQQKIEAAPDPVIAELAARCLAAAESHHLHFLSQSLGIPVDALRSLHVGWLAEEEAWTFPEKNHREEIVGIQKRYEDGTKSFIRGGQRGLILPAGWSDGTGPIYIPEGASDVAAFVAAGCTAIGRPSATGGVEYLARTLAGEQREIVIVGENDEHDGRWPGKEGAERTARILGQRLGRDVTVRLPLHGYKDFRAAFLKGKTR